MSLLSFEIVFNYKMVQLTGKIAKESQPLLSFAIIEKGANHEFVKNHLREINSNFLKLYSINDIFLREPKFFKNFIPQIEDILGDLRFTLEDRLKTVFRH